MKKMRAMYYKPGWMAREPTIEFILPDEVDLIDELAKYGVDYSKMSIGRYGFPIGTTCPEIQALIDYFEDAYENPEQAVMTIPMSTFAYVVKDIYDAGAFYLAPERDPSCDCIAKSAMDEEMAVAASEGDEEKVPVLQEALRDRRKSKELPS